MQIRRTRWVHQAGSLQNQSPCPSRKGRRPNLEDNSSASYDLFEFPTGRTQNDGDSFSRGSYRSPANCWRHACRQSSRRRSRAGLLARRRIRSIAHGGIARAGRVPSSLLSRRRGTVRHDEPSSLAWPPFQRKWKAGVSKRQKRGAGRRSQRRLIRPRARHGRLGAEKSPKESRPNPIAIAAAVTATKLAAADDGSLLQKASSVYGEES